MAENNNKIPWHSDSVFFDTFKARIKTKFGTMARFAELADISRYELQKAFMPFYWGKKPYVELLRKAIKKSADIDPSPTAAELDNETLHKLKTAINEAGGVYKFCKRNKKFTPRSLYFIFAGERVRKSGVVLDLLKKFKIE